MDKQKQIEESKSCYSCNHYYACEDCYKAFTRSKDYFKKHIAHNREIAMRCKCYQPKIPENVVVLTQDELHERLNHAYDVGIESGKEVGSKETAERFAERLREETWQAWIDDDHYDWIVTLDDIDEICKEITEGINNG